MTLIFSDHYTGPRFKYGISIVRPIGGLPEGWIVYSWEEHPDFEGGSIEYPHPLDDFLVTQFDFVLIP